MARRTSRTTNRTNGTRGRRITTRAATKKKKPIASGIHKSTRGGQRKRFDFGAAAREIQRRGKAAAATPRTKALPSTARPVALPKGMGRPVYKQSPSPALKTEKEGWGYARHGGLGARLSKVTPIPPGSRWVKRNGKSVLAFKNLVKRRRPRYDI